MAVGGSGVSNFAYTSGVVRSVIGQDGVGGLGVRASFEAAFTPASLPGLVAWYDVSDLSTLFTTSTGTTQVAAADDPVGFVGDKSQGFVTGLEKVENPGNPFSTTNGWAASDSTLSVVDGWLRVTNTGSFGRARESFSVVQGDWFVAEYRVRPVGSVLANVRIGSTLGGTDYYNTSHSSDTGLVSVKFRASSSATVFLEVNSISGVGEEVEFLFFSTKELPGNHLTQSTATARPLYKDGDGQYLWGDGIDDIIHSGLFTAVSQPNTLVFGFQFRATPNSVLHAVSGDGTTARHDFIHGNAGQADWRISSGTTVAGGSLDTGKHVVAIEFNSPNSRLFIDGIEIISSADTGSNALTRITLLGILGGSVSASNIWQYAAYNRLLTTAEREQVEAFVAGKNGVTL